MVLQEPMSVRHLPSLISSAAVYLALSSTNATTTATTTPNDADCRPSVWVRSFHIVTSFHQFVVCVPDSRAAANVRIRRKRPAHVHPRNACCSSYSLQSRLFT